MADKPYTERTGGSYVRDSTGKLTRAEDIKPEPVETDRRPAANPERKGK